jgi:hypothetical protein
MGSASRRKQVRGGGAAARALPSRPAGNGILDSAVRNRELILAIIAGCFWLLGHGPAAIANLAIPAWVLAGLALGLLSPWFGLLLTLITVPFLGGSTDAITGEVLRVVPIHGAALRVLFDRFALGRTISGEPPAWVVVCAAVAAGLYALTVQTGTVAVGDDPAFRDSGIRWVIGGSMAMMSAWIAASRLVAGRERTFTDVVLVTLAVACVAALAAYAALPWVGALTFPGVVNGRLAALGYPTPTAMGVAISLPFAVAAAWRRTRWLAFLMIGLAIAVMVLTISRGPLIAIGLGLVAAVLAGGRIDRRILIPGLLASAVALAVFVALRYGTSPAQIAASFSGAMGSDVDRVMTWAAAVSITVASPILGGGWRSIERFGTFAQARVAYAHNTILHGFAEGGIPLGLTNGAAILFSVVTVWRRRRTMATYLIAAAVVFFVCGFWDIPQARSYASVMGGMAMGMAAGPLIGRRDGSGGT